MASRAEAVISLREKELVFEFTGARSGVKFDDVARPLDCMKSVDFVVEYETYDLFVEVKDPDKTGLTSDDRKAFIEKYKAGKLVEDLARKYRDSWLYRWAEHRDKPVHYAVLLQLESLGPALLSTVMGRLKGALPVSGAPTWTRPFVQSAVVLDIAAWNAHGRYGTVRRVPRGPDTLG